MWTGEQAAASAVGGTCRWRRTRVAAGRAATRRPGRRWVIGCSIGSIAKGRVVRAVAGFDATFSAPKSLSVLWALTGDDATARRPRRRGARGAAHLERFGSTTRIRVERPPAASRTRSGLTMATFRQTTSRADDPQIHTHAVISAKVQTADGRWLALDARYLKRKQRMLGGIYQSVLRAELAHRFGVAWGRVVNGQAEIAGMPDELLEVFSKRAGQSTPPSSVKLDEFRSPAGTRPDALGTRRVDPRGGGRHPRRTSPATVSPICGHGGSTKPPQLGWTRRAGRRRGRGRRPQRQPTGRRR